MGASAKAGQVSMGGTAQPPPPPNPPIGPPPHRLYTMLLDLVPPPPPSGSAGTELDPGDRIELFDVHGLRSGSPATASGGPFAFDTSNTGPLPPSTSFTDDPSVPNLVLTYLGAPVIALPGGAPIEIGQFTFITDGFASVPSFNFAAETSDLSLSGGTSEGVSYGVAPVTPIPEPASWILVLMAIPAALGIAGLRRARDDG
jgi:hypothetical protein